ncbi:MAG: HrgA protein [Clostridia bacterium]|nr:HrgA protein [Clostridia bacterium]
MSYGFKEFAIEVLNTLNKPLSKMEIWEEGVKLGLDKKLGTQGKTPWHSISARIYTEIKDGINPRFKQVSKRPALFALVGQEFTEKDIDKSSKANNELANEESSYKERDLHPILVKYLFSSSHFKCLTKTIYHEQSKKKSKNSDKWIHPDLIGIYFPFDDYENLTLQAIPVLKEKSYKIFTFEMKVNITLANLREYFFQAVSNSSWANEGYLVAPEISEDDDFLSELSMLNNAFGIGVIKLNIEIPEQSEILFYSRQKANVDINMIDKLIEKNQNVKDVFEALIDSEKLSKVSNKSKFDKILDDDEYEKYLKEKRILKK